MNFNQYVQNVIKKQLYVKRRYWGIRSTKIIPFEKYISQIIKSLQNKNCTACYNKLLVLFFVIVEQLILLCKVENYLRRVTTSYDE